MLDLPTDVRPEIVPLSWLIGSWSGTGVIDYSVGDERISGEFSYRATFAPAGDALRYEAKAALLEPADGWSADLLDEVGFWRVAHPAVASDPGPALLPATAVRASVSTEDVESWRSESGGFGIEVSVAHGDGALALYVGEVSGPRIDLASDAIVRPQSAKSFTAATRIYGLVESHLLWAWDIAALGSDLSSHASARLERDRVDG